MILGQDLFKDIPSKKESISHIPASSFSKILTIQPVYFDSNSIEFPAPNIFELCVLELKKLQFQTSPTFSSIILTKTQLLLKSILGEHHSIFGGDEIFQSFVFVICHSSIPFLSFISDFLEFFSLFDLTPSRFSYLHQQFQSAILFIKTRQISCPPSLILGADLQPSQFVQESTVPIKLSRVALFCSKNLDRTYFVYTGNSKDFCFGFKFSLDFKLNDFSDLSPISTTEGTIFFCDINFVQTKKLIKIPSGNFPRSHSDIRQFSSFLYFVPHSHSHFLSLDQLSWFQERFQNVWKNKSVSEIILEIQRFLNQKLTKSIFPEDGFMSENLFFFIKKVIGVQRDSHLFLTPRVVECIFQSKVALK